MSNLKKRLNDAPPCAWDEAYSITVMNDEQTEDLVNYPLHYNKGNIACIEAMEAMLTKEEWIGYLRGNIFKYNWRFRDKNGVEDLQKANWYQDKLIETLHKENEHG